MSKVQCPARDLEWLLYLGPHQQIQSIRFFDFGLWTLDFGLSRSSLFLVARTHNCLDIAPNVEVAFNLHA
jgi:hypothetical protein